MGYAGVLLEDDDKDKQVKQGFEKAPKKSDQRVFVP